MTRRSVGTLLAEGLLIVVGVLVALAVESWREERADLSLVDSYLSSFQTEMVEDTFLNRVYIGVSRERSRSLRRLLDDLAGTTSALSPSDELIALHWAYNDDFPLYVSSVLEELLVTGNARLLDESVLRALQAVSHRFTISDRVIAGLNFPLEAQAPGLVPGHMRRAIRESVRAGGTWLIEQQRMDQAADSLLGSASTAEVAAIQSWRAIPRMRLLLEEQAYSSAAYTEELEQNREALVAALEIIATPGR
jgi:hypothetical protein